MVNLGSDVVSDWSFEDGDLQTVSGTGNLIQAISNRLNTYTGDLSSFYADFGSILFDYMGELNKPTTHEYIRLEVENELIKDKRIINANCTVNKIGSGEVECTLNVVLVDGSDVDLNMIITSENEVRITNGVEY